MRVAQGRIDAHSHPCMFWGLASSAPTPLRPPSVPGPSAVSAVASDGALIACGSADGCISLWTWNLERAPLEGIRHASGICALALSPAMCTPSASATVCAPSASAASISLDGAELVVGSCSGMELCMWSPAAPTRCLRTGAPPGEGFTCASWSACGRLLAVGLRSGGVWLRGRGGGAQRTLAGAGLGACMGLAWLPTRVAHKSAGTQSEAHRGSEPTSHSEAHRVSEPGAHGAYSASHKGLLPPGAQGDSQQADMDPCCCLLSASAGGALMGWRGGWGAPMPGM